MEFRTWNRLTLRRSYGIMLLGLLALGPLFGCGDAKGTAGAPPGDFREGDVLFQHLDSKLCEVIRDVSGSQLTHCGLVVRREGKTYVLEAMAPAVRYTPIENWFDQGWKGYYAHYRPRGISREKIAKVAKQAAALTGKTYDLQYEMSDEKIYCSELVYKGFLRGANLEIGQKQKLGDLKWQAHETFIRLLAGGELPLGRVMVTPATVAASPHLELLTNTFPQSLRQKHPEARTKRKKKL
jgi:permuted papain-like amidase YaeF/Yiix C92 family enzyme